LPLFFCSSPQSHLLDICRINVSIAEVAYS
jgi:hypothetical protein